jgi:putative NIF3 family GTP cyclohydrolase 1 type 2
MKTYELIDLLTSRIPKSATWSASDGEPYGEYYVVDDMAEIHKALFCVTPSSDVIKYARLHNYDIVIGHHPFVVPTIFPQMIFHTALDMCEGGLNDWWRDRMGIQNASHIYENMGWYGEVEPITFGNLVSKVRRECGDIFGQIHKKSNQKVHSIAVCSGLGGMVTSLLEMPQVDCIITGELCCPAKEIDADFVIETGHTNSEWMGVEIIRNILAPFDVTVNIAPREIDIFGSEVFRGIED